VIQLCWKSLLYGVDEHQALTAFKCHSTSNLLLSLLSLVSVSVVDIQLYMFTNLLVSKYTFVLLSTFVQSECFDAVVICHEEH